MNALIINASKDINSRTTQIAQTLFEGIDTQVINLSEYHIAQIDQRDSKDQFQEVVDQIAHTDFIAFGTPVYWSDMTGYMKTFIDRMSDVMDVALDSPNNAFFNKTAYLIIQGTAPEDAIPHVEHVISHVSRRFYLNYQGYITNEDEARDENRKIKNA